MRRVLRSFTTVLALVVVMAGVAGGAAHAEVRAGYVVDDGVVVTIGGGTLIGGDVVRVPVTVTRTVDGVQVPVVCNVLRVSTSPDLVESFVGGGSATYDLRLGTKVVRDVTRTVVTATCEYTPFGPGGGTASASNVITLLPLGSSVGGDGSGILPTTGTEVGLWLLVVGGVLVLGGGALAARRRRS
ncbi:LPXTG cell wall anchor domain-containing protein [Aeromicrobium alkaliterrae]|uniref:Gram-positive cocci surface proteins LPxTG domain-containing protein n=1 Tax=Aeromicrobium alkaliterrae TaxID=302168 RepID=A0ABN2JQP5_9ACTN